jgi:hypothetical protein
MSTSASVSVVVPPPPPPPPTREEIEAAIQASHNPTLVKEAFVYKLWSDGEMTYQNGGTLYGSRSRMVKCLHPDWQGNEAINFEMNVYAGPFTYAIMTENDCLRIRLLMYRHAGIIPPELLFVVDD